MYNNEQVSKVFRQNFSWNLPENGSYGHVKEKP